MPRQYRTEFQSSHLVDREDCESAALVLSQSAKSATNLRRSGRPIAIRCQANSLKLHRPLQTAVRANSQRWISPLQISGSSDPHWFVQLLSFRRLANCGRSSHLRSFCTGAFCREPCWRVDIALFRSLARAAWVNFTAPMICGLDKCRVEGPAAETGSRPTVTRAFSRGSPTDTTDQSPQCLPRL